MFSPQYDSPGTVSRAEGKGWGAMQRATASETPAYPWLKSYPADVDWGAEIPVKPMHLLLEEAVTRFAGRICIDFLDRRYSFAEIGRLANRAAKGLQALGVGPGVKVGLHLPNCPYSVICYYAVLKTGGMLVSGVSPLDAALAARHGVEARFFLVDVTTMHLTRLAEMIDAGDLEANIGIVLPLSEARIAHRMLEGTQPHPRGKIVLEVGG